MNRYLTWRELFELRAKLNLTAEQLDEPAIFTVQDGYGDQLAYPVGYWTESIHPSDGTASLCLDGEELEMLLPGEFEQDEEEGHEQDEEYPRKQLRKLPLGALRLGFSEMDEDFEEATTWLAQPNPHTLPPATTTQARPLPPRPMKYHILLPLTIEADPADVAGAARKGFAALADLFNSGQPISLHLLPQDGSDEARMAQVVLDCCFVASSTPQQ